MKLKQRIEKKSDVKGLRNLLEEVKEKEVFDSKSFATHMRCLGITEDWLISNGFQIKKYYTEKESYKICMTSYYESLLKNYLLKSKKELVDYADFFYVNDVPFINVDEIKCFNSNILVRMLFAVNSTSLFFMFSGNLYISILFLDSISDEVAFLKDFEINTQKQVLVDYFKTYVMFDEKTEYYKIGRAKNVTYREKTLQSEKPSIKLILFSDKNIEKELHAKFKSKRIRGEWFDLNADNLLELIEDYKFKKP